MLTIGGTEIDLSMVPEEAREALASSITDAHEADIAGLKQKNSNLIQANKSLKAGGVDARVHDELAQAQEQMAELNAKLKAADGVKSRLESKLASEVQAREKIQGEFTSAKIDAELSSALTAAGVSNPAYLSASKALLKGQLSLGEDGVTMGDKPLAEALKEWTGSDEGKAFISAPTGGSGPAKGGKGGYSGENPFAEGSINLTKQAAVIKENPELAEQMKAEAKGAA